MRPSSSCPSSSPSSSSAALMNPTTTTSFEGRAPWSDAPRRSSSPPWSGATRARVLSCAQGKAHARPGSRSRLVLAIARLRRRRPQGATVFSILLSAGSSSVLSVSRLTPHVICFDHCCLEVCRLSKFSFFDRYLLQSTRSRVGSRGCTVFRSRGARPPPRTPQGQAAEPHRARPGAARHIPHARFGAGGHFQIHSSYLKFTSLETHKS